MSLFWMLLVAVYVPAFAAWIGVLCGEGADDWEPNLPPARLVDLELSP